ncbi:hypothetical protein [Shewanella algae]
MNKKSAVLPWVSMGLLALVSLGGCSNGIDFSFDARREGKIDPQVFPAKR